MGDLAALMSQLLTNNNSRANAAKLTNRHLLSEAGVSQLQQVTFKGLKEHKRHNGRIIHAVVRSLAWSNGLYMTVVDSAGRDGQIWSLIDHPIPGGEQALSAGVIVAVKEPLFGRTLNDRIAVCVHHPTDLLRISKFDPTAVALFPELQRESIKDFISTGDKKEKNNEIFKAIDVYTEGIRQERTSSNANSANNTVLRGLLKKRAMAFSNIGLYALAFADVQDLLNINSKHRDALRLACTICLALEKYELAKEYAESLGSLGASKQKITNTIDEVMERCKQARGEIDLSAIATSMSKEYEVPRISDYIGPIKLEDSSFGGRGIFATSKISRGQLLLCEKPLSLFAEKHHNLSSLKNGLSNVMTEGGGFISQITMSHVQRMVTRTNADPELRRRLFDLYHGQDEDAGLSHDLGKEAFDRYADQLFLQDLC